MNAKEWAQLEEYLRRRRILAAAIGLRIIRRKRRRARRRIWVRDWIQRRNEGLGTLHLHHNELRVEDSDSYVNYCRMSEGIFEELLGRIDHRIRRRDTVIRQAIPPRQRLAVTLWFLASGNEFKDLQYATRMPANTISVVVADTMKAIIAELKDECIKCPSSPEEWKRVEEQFRVLWNFPHCVGALDGKHINFRPLRMSGSYYRNYKGTDSIVLLGLVDARCRFLFVDIGRNGRMNDAAVYTDSDLGRGIRAGSLHLPAQCPLQGDVNNILMPYVITADDAFPLATYMMKPFPQRGLSHNERIFNYRLSRALRIVENAFGILVNRIRVLLKTIGLSVEKVEMITMACCILHNFILALKPLALITGDDDLPAEEGVNDCPLRGLRPQGGLNPPESAKTVREHFMNYFNTVGSVGWQDERVEGGPY